MQDIERLAAFTMIDSIEHQLQGLKRLLAGAANLGTPAQGRTTRVEPRVEESSYASDEEDARLAEMFEKQRQHEMAAMAGRAEKAHSGLWSETAGELAQG